MKIERLGAWYALDKLNASQIPPFLTLLERLNYDVLWYPESRGYESLSLASFLLGNSTKLKIGSSIASIYARDAFAARRGMLSLNSLYRDRFILGLGVSHAPMVQGVRGHTYAKPVAAMRAYLESITKDQSGSEEWPIAIAALGPLMLKLAGERTRRSTRLGQRSISGPASGWQSSKKSAWRRMLGERARSAARNSRATWSSTTIATAGSASASRRRIWPVAAPIASLMRWWYGAMQRP